MLTWRLSCALLAVTLTLEVDGDVGSLVVLQLACPSTPPAEPVLGTSNPQCTPCAALNNPDLCKYDASECESVAPGGSCHIHCRAPYKANSTVARCPAGNNDRTRPLTYTALPDCGCPNPPESEGYVNSSSGWQCASGYIGTPMTQCSSSPTCTPESPSVVAKLSGCNRLVPCAVPEVDPCRFDVSACTGVMPGQRCEVRCKQPYVGGYTVASCPDRNIDSSTQLSRWSLVCSLDNCPDPASPQPGYSKSAGMWKCADGWSGSVTKQCNPSRNWSITCHAEAVLSGCKRIVPCSAPALTGTDVCMYNTNACQDVPPGASCQVTCQSPYTGIASTASCPPGNTNPSGMQWDKPAGQCTLQNTACPDPAILEIGYIRIGNELRCAQSYRGDPTKSCVGTDNCGVLPVISGCVQLSNCNAPASDCKYDMSDCVSVPPGSSCTIRCKAPFAGGSTTGTCLDGNTDPNGLMWTNPTCTRLGCADPPVLAPGYARSPSGLVCDSGFAGMVQKSCQWREADCSAVVDLSGCTRQSACQALVLNDTTDRCQYNVSGCGSVLAGSSCTVGCKAPYTGTGALASCPRGNTNESTPLNWTRPQCDCPDPGVATGYNKTNGVWLCIPGYAGRARKRCFSAEDCSAVPLLEGCYVPVACHVSTILEGGASGRSLLAGTFNFGPALVQGVIDETDVASYRVYFATECNVLIGSPVDELVPTQTSPTCCQNDLYQAVIREPIPDGARKLVLVVNLHNGETSVARLVVDLQNRSLVPLALTGDAMHSSDRTWVLLLAVVIAPSVARHWCTLCWCMLSS